MSLLQRETPFLGMMPNGEPGAMWSVVSRATIPIEAIVLGQNIFERSSVDSGRESIILPTIWHAVRGIQDATAQLEMVEPVIHKSEVIKTKREVAEHRYGEMLAAKPPDTKHEDVIKSYDFVLKTRRKELATLRSLDTRYRHRVERGGLVDQVKQLTRNLGEGNAVVDQFLQTRVDKRKDNNPAEAFKDILQSEIDIDLAPILFDKMLGFMKKRGLYDQIEVVEGYMRESMRRSILRSQAEHGNKLSTAQINKQIDRCFALHVQRYLQKVLLTEGRVDTGELWEEKAKSIRIRDITPGMIHDVFDIYRLAGKRMNPNYDPKYRHQISNPWESRLVMPGGILEPTQDFVHATRHKTLSNGKDRVYTGWESTRARFLMIALEGISSSVLKGYLVQEEKYVDLRSNVAINLALEERALGIDAGEQMIKKLRLRSRIRRKLSLVKKPYSLREKRRLDETAIAVKSGWNKPLWLNVETGDLESASGVVVKRVEDPDVVRNFYGVPERRAKRQAGVTAVTSMNDENRRDFELTRLFAKLAEFSGSATILALLGLIKSSKL